MPPRRNTRSAAKAKQPAAPAAARITKSRTTAATTSTKTKKLPGATRPRPTQEVDSANDLFDTDVEVLASPIHIKGSSAGKRSHVDQVSEDDVDAEDLADDASDAGEEVDTDADADAADLYYLGKDLDSYDPKYIDDSAILGEDDREDADSQNEDEDMVVDDGEDLVVTDDEEQDRSDREDDEEDAAPSAGTSPKKRRATGATKSTPPNKKPRKREVPVDDSDSEAGEMKLSDYAAGDSLHPLNVQSPLGKLWFGPGAWLLEFDRYGEFHKWQVDRCVKERSVLSQMPAKMLPVTEWDFVLKTHQLPQYTAWLDSTLAEKFHDEAWMSQFEDLAPEQAVEETREATPEPSPATPVRKSARKGKERQREPITPPKTPQKVPAAKTAAKSRSKTHPAAPQTPTTAVTNQFQDLALWREEAQAWVTKIVDKQEDAPMPGIRMAGIQERDPSILKGGGPLRVIDLVEDVLRSDTFSHLKPRGKANIAMLTCTPQFGHHIYNVALMPENTVCSFPKATTNPKPELLELYRSGLKGGSPAGRAACVMYGLAAAESQLLHPQTLQLKETMLSKTVNILPLGAQFRRMYSLMFNVFDLEVLKIAAYRQGLTLRTRLANAGGTVVGTELGGNTHNAGDALAMPDYLTQLQRSANDTIPIYDATEYFTGKKQRQPFNLGIQDVACPKLKRELRSTDFVAVVHSVNSYVSTMHNDHGLSFNVYYVVLLVSGN